MSSSNEDNSNLLEDFPSRSPYKSVHDGVIVDGKANKGSSITGRYEIGGDDSSVRSESSLNPVAAVAQKARFTLKNISMRNIMASDAVNDNSGGGLNDSFHTCQSEMTIDKKKEGSGKKKLSTTSNETEAIKETDSASGDSKSNEKGSKQNDNNTEQRRSKKLLDFSALSTSYRNLRKDETKEQKAINVASPPMQKIRGPDLAVDFPKRGARIEEEVFSSPLSPIVAKKPSTKTSSDQTASKSSLALDFPKKGDGIDEEVVSSTSTTVETTDSKTSLDQVSTTSKDDEGVLVSLQEASTIQKTETKAPKTGSKESNGPEKKLLVETPSLDRESIETMDNDVFTKVQDVDDEVVIKGDTFSEEKKNGIFEEDEGVEEEVHAKLDVISSTAAVKSPVTDDVEYPTDYDGDTESRRRKLSKQEVKDSPVNKKDVKRAKSKKKKSTKTSFTADSPYFAAYVDKEINSQSLLATTLRDISKRARLVGQSGVTMAEATRQLSISCKLENPSPFFNELNMNEKGSKMRERKYRQDRRESVGEEMLSTLKLLGDVLDEIADAQVKLCESIVGSLCVPLEKFVDVELRESISLKSEAERLTEYAETLFSKHLHGKNVDRSNVEIEESLLQPNTSIASSVLNNFSSQVGNRFTSQLGNFGRLATPFGGTESSEDSNGLTSGSDSAPYKNGEKDPKFTQAVAVASFRQNLQEIRLAQATAELKRFQLLRLLDSLKTRRTFELSESALTSLHGIRAHYHHCSDLTQGLTSRLHNIQVNQSDARRTYESQQHPWEKREKSLAAAIRKVGVAASNAQVIVDTLMKSNSTQEVQALANHQPKTLQEVEDQVELWDLPQRLAETSLYQRDPTPGVLMEGWLYKKSTNRMSLQSWNRRWFILDKTGVYYLRGGIVGDKGSELSNKLERVKVCEIVLCTVREATDKTKGVQKLRYCFEIITPNTKPYMLQACGPKEYRSWVDSIRSCIENQLCNGSMNADMNLSSSGRGDSVGSNDSTSPPTAREKINSKLRRGQGSLYEKEGIPFGEGIGPGFCVPDLSGTEDEMTSSSNHDVDSQDNRRTSRNPLIQRIMKENPYCADCNAASPDWASLNIGVLLCIECSGVHRSLGVHLSKVRSLTLDDISRPEALVLLSLGNQVMNSIWEAGIKSQKGWVKPSAKDSRKTKEDWIKSKYVWKGFLEYNPEDGRELEERESKFGVAMYNAAKEGNIHSIAEAMAKGGRVDWKHKDDGKTALHMCAVSSSTAFDNEGVNGAGPLVKTNSTADADVLTKICCAELLIQNGAKIDSRDNDTQTVLDSAVLSNAPREMIEYLSAKANSLK